MSEALLDHALRDLGAHLAWPPVVDLAPRVHAEVENVVPLRARPRARRVLVLAAAALLVFAGLLAVSPGLRAAFFRLIGIPGATVEVHETAPPLPPDSGPERLPFEREVTLSEAQAEAAFPLAVPRDLGEPERVLLLGSGDTAVVTFTYRDGEVVLTQFRGELQPELFGKVAMETQVREVRAAGEPGIWVEGPHTVYLKGPTAMGIVSEPRTSGDALLWTHQGITFRLEGTAGLEDALRIALTVAL